MDIRNDPLPFREAHEKTYFIFAGRTAIIKGLQMIRKKRAQLMMDVPYGVISYTKYQSEELESKAE